MANPSLTERVAGGSNDRVVILRGAFKRVVSGIDDLLVAILMLSQPRIRVNASSDAEARLRRVVFSRGDFNRGVWIESEIP
jgi:hypothetical protein